jgi:hypothetical protein
MQYSLITIDDDGDIETRFTTKLNCGADDTCKIDNIVWTGETTYLLSVQVKPTDATKPSIYQFYQGNTLDNGNTQVNFGEESFSNYTITKLVSVN